jgi:hypothetical protein
VRRAATLVLVLVLARSAVADPILDVPRVGKLRWGGGDEDVGILGVIGDAHMLGVIAASRLAQWPDRQQGIEPGTPQLAAGRVGLVFHYRCVPLSLVLRGDFGEPARAYVDGPGTAIASSIVDDAYAMWRIARPAQLVIGRARIPFTRARQFDESDEPLGSSPFLVDRIVPDRRTGAALHGDLGALAYAGGVYEDLDDLEPRARTDDPSSGGQLAAAAHLEWTPRAPMYGSNPPGQIPGARGPLPTPRADPWFGTWRPSIGAGALYRRRDDGASRVDLSFSVHSKWRWLAVLAEIVGTPLDDDLDTAFGAHAAVMITPIDPLAFTGRGEWDGGFGEDGTWTAGGGVTWHVTRDRKNKVAFVGFYRRDVARDTAYDGAVVYLQASL